MLVPNKMQHVICTGNLGSKQQYEELRQLARTYNTVILILLNIYFHPLLISSQCMYGTVLD